jgi:hypothetical protein
MRASGHPASVLVAEWLADSSPAAEIASQKFVPCMQDVSTAMSACGKLGCRAMAFFKAAAAAADEWLPHTTARDLAEVGANTCGLSLGHA